MTRILAETKLGNEEFLFKLTEESFREQSSELNYNHEGIDSLSVIPDERLERIYKWLLKNPIALLRSPPGSDTFWNDLKGLQQTEIKRTFLHVLLLNMYGEKRGNEGHEMVATPICFNATLGLSDLLLPKNEYEDLVDRHKNKDSPPLERCWQMEWYRSATTVLRSANISPDIGSGFNANGFLDFYVNGYLRWGKWSIREHPLKKWAIIDFRHHTKKVRKLQRGFWHAFYSDDFKTIRIRRLNHPDITLTLRDE
ncbi:hypothetical protein RhiirC2_718711 [Rhizophagus irregularis]|uniref:Uncharacterized protein n=1 Tax=Rhizophagus irregularis TaxID=588596 RepID=A0A2N1MHB8_9GLOM|nr:hypothetical protein RhiirC2_718711 [Rhizophagus irregularis]